MVATKAREAFQTLNHRLAREEMRKLGEKLRDGEITAAAFRRGMEKELKSSVVAAYRFEVKHKLSDSDLDRVNGVLSKNSEYLQSFLNDIESKEPGDWIASRAASYSGAVTEAKAEGTIAANEDDALLEWRGPDGENSCDDCAALIGETRTAAEWRDSGELPSQVACLGNCRCELVAA